MEGYDAKLPIMDRDYRKVKWQQTKMLETKIVDRFRIVSNQANQQMW